MNAAARADMERIAQRAEIVSDTRYRWDREEAGFTAGSKVAGAMPDAPPIVAELASRIYERAYTSPDAGVGNVQPLYDPLLVKSFVKTLDQANASRWSWIPGWRVKQTRGEKLIVTNEQGAERVVDTDDFAVDAAGEGQLRVLKGSAEQQPGWYHVRSEKPNKPAPGEAVVRVYWNICRQGAVPLVSSLTQLLDRRQVGYHFKVASDPQRFMRADSAVLYVRDSEWRACSRLLPRIHEDVSLYLKPATPLFTQRVAPGVSLAEDPGDGASFGVSRARLCAWALWDAYRLGETSVAAKVERMTRRFLDHGLDPERPHLRPGSAADYPLELTPLAIPFGGR